MIMNTEPDFDVEFWRKGNKNMTIVEQILLGIVVFVILYIIFAPWLAQIDISKNTDSIAKELEEINKTLKELKWNAERKEDG